MKPSSFEYVRPESLAETLDLLHQDPEESKVLAGGQSLVPMMNFRLARPSRLIDINRVPGLAGTRVEGDRLVIGTRTRHLAVQNMSGADPLARLLRSAAAHVGHLPIRTRGTFGGSLAHSDAASEWCLIARLLDATMVVESRARGRREIPAADFFLSIFTTAMEPDELLVEVSLPRLGDEHRTGFAEFARRAGDFAIVAVTTDLAVEKGVVTHARVCIGGVADTPFRSGAAEATLVGQRLDDDIATSPLARAAAEAAASEVDPPSDAHGDAPYRRDLVRAMLTSSLAQGVAR
ncbi:FAD binding domain-containing protein [Nocardioides daejeonensis]|uniref:FAD binding domain-containing protein n=1 Tax=Nocardioides daejeonensis TaxID=1046556 RepID=UPI000D747B44|nr:FAD binding domain-containing protein [Nocardioides daejeonensis]